MALSAATVLEIRVGGSDANGGGFVTGASGTDRSQQAAAQIAYTDLVIDATTTTKLTSAGNPFTAAEVGNLINVTGGTGFTTGWYQVVSVASAVATMDRAVGTAGSTGGTGNLGGALASPGGLGAVLAAQGVAGMKAWCKTGTYTLTTTTANVSGGSLDLSVAGIASKLFTLEGYGTTRGDLGTAPIFDVAALTTFTVLKTSGIGSNRQHCIINITIDGQLGASVIGFDGSTAAGWGINQFYLCTAIDCTTGFQGTAPARNRCKATGSTTGFKDGHNLHCEAATCTDGFLLTGSNTSFLNCLARGCTTGFNFAAIGVSVVVGNTADGNSGDGFKSTSLDNIIFCGNLSTNNGGYGYNFAAGAKNFLSVSNANFNNTSGNWANTPLNNFGFVTPTGDPYVDKAGLDFRPDATAGEGAALRGAFLAIVSQINNRDIGAVQHTDPVGGGGRACIIGG